jgi:propanol-preferring alcohol dehydrogenase
VTLTTKNLSLQKIWRAQYTFNSKDPETAAHILKITGSKKPKRSRFCWNPIDLALATQVVGLDGDLTVVGLGGGHLDWHAFAISFGVNVKNPYWGFRTELMEVVD